MRCDKSMCIQRQASSSTSMCSAYPHPRSIRIAASFIPAGPQTTTTVRGDGLGSAERSIAWLMRPEVSSLGFPLPTKGTPRTVFTRGLVAFLCCNFEASRSRSTVM